VQRAAASSEFEIIENLRKAGVQTTRTNERLRFRRLEPSGLRARPATLERMRPLD
jgi:hypothetical protein